MDESSGGMSIPIQDICIFSGLFKPPQAYRNDLSIHGIGVAKDNDEDFFIASYTSPMKPEGYTFRFHASPTGKEDFIKFLTSHIHSEVIGIIIADFPILHFLIDEHKNRNYSKDDLKTNESINEVFSIEFHPIMAKMVVAYLSIIQNQKPHPKGWGMLWTALPRNPGFLDSGFPNLHCPGFLDL